MKTITAIVLAAGMSSRMKEYKILLDINGKPLIQYALQSIHNLTNNIIIVGGYNFSTLATYLSFLPEAKNIDIVYNKNYKNGLSTSLITGLDMAEPTDSILICLGDMPNIPRTLIEQMICVFHTVSEDTIIAPFCNGKRGHPVIIPKKYFSEIRSLQGDKGASSLLKKYQSHIYGITTDSTGIFLDLDNTEDIKLYQKGIQA